MLWKWCKRGESGRGSILYLTPCRQVYFFLASCTYNYSIENFWPSTNKYVRFSAFSCDNLWMIWMKMRMWFNLKTIFYIHHKIAAYKANVVLATWLESGIWGWPKDREKSEVGNSLWRLSIPEITTTIVSRAGGWTIFLCEQTSKISRVWLEVL